MEYRNLSHENRSLETIKNSLENGLAVFDSEHWEQITNYIIDNYSNIIALRGAGSNNGMDKVSIDTLIEDELMPRIKKDLAEGPLAIIFDGDEDSLDKPDIGYVMGRMRDYFKGEDFSKILFIAAQKKSWYYPATENGNLANANNEPYFTYVFEDSESTGDHNAFTQSSLFVASEKYQQWYIGASGDIANQQLSDYEIKVPDGKKRSATIFKVPNNATLDEDLKQKLDEAEANADNAKIDRFNKIIEHRKNTFGSHWTADGTPSVDKMAYPKLDIDFV